VLDQAASSLTNFGLTFIVLRSTGLEEFGAFTVSFLAYQMALNLGRALAAEPLVIRFSAAQPSETGPAVAAATGALLAIGAIAGAIMGVAALLLGPPARQAMLVFAAFMPFLLLQDGIRFGFFAGGSPKRAFWNDLIWGAGTFLLLAVVLWSGTDSLPALMSCWGAAGLVAAAVGVQRIGQIPRINAVAQWFRDHGDLGRRYIVESGFAQGGGYLALFAVSAIAGLSALGAINGARVLFGPINVLYTGLMAFAVPEGVRLLSRNPERLVPTVRRFGIVLAIPALVLGGVLFLLPTSVGQALVQESDWSAIRELLAPTALLVSAQGYSDSRKAGLRIVADARQSMWAQIYASPFVVVGAAVGAALFESRGAAWGMAFAAGVAAFIWVYMFARSREVALATRVHGPQ
jgi:hypothetical protein